MKSSWSTVEFFIHLFNKAPYGRSQCLPGVGPIGRPTSAQRGPPGHGWMEKKHVLSADVDFLGIEFN